ncbi:MAG TPA: DnaA/Hda family protein [Xanthobacteraceae bacterium]|nr:DnaA/Hda family protein [Xanthobacteraceae bacterium]
MAVAQPTDSGTRPRQLSLALQHAESFAREDFFAGASNAAALALVENWPDWPSPAMVLAGPEGCGKSHLAAIWAAASGARIIAARALSEARPPAALATGALVIEDLAPGNIDEAALFHLLNFAREEDASILVTTRTPPAGWAIGLHDLASRLRALPVVTLAAPEDSLLRAVMVKLAADRQLAIEEDVISYVLRRIERSFAAARTAMIRLDHEALQQKRPITRALAGELFRARHA